LASVSPGDVEAYVAFLRTSNLETDPDQPVRSRKPRSVARSLAAVRGLHRFRVDELGGASDPTADVGAPRLPQSVPKALTEDEVNLLLGAVGGERAVDLRDRAILEVLYGTGVRISELVGLSLGDLDLEIPVMRVLGKGAKERVVPLGRYAARSLTDWLGPAGRGRLAPERWARRGDAEAVFLNARGGRLSRAGAWGVVRRYGDRVGLGARLTPHVLRHSCATHMLDRGADIRVVQELLGHASVATTQVYTKVTGERLRAVYESAHPRARRRP
jgi:integrase/recombinase XerD